MTPMNSAEQVRARLLGRPEDEFRSARLTSRAGWRTLGLLGPLFFTIVGGIMRFWHVGAPHQLIFDETYYVKQGWSMMLFGFEMKVDPVLLEAKQVDQHFTANDPFVWGTEGDFVVHPPVGKWLIGWGEVPFGILNSFGWRFAVALAGTLSILMLGLIARRLFRSDLMGTLAAALLAFEGHHFVHSRTGLLDIFVMFFGLAAFGALLIDRDRARAVLAQRVAGVSRHHLTFIGPWIGWRPWRWVAGVCLGLSAGSKWSGLYFLAAFGVLTVLWDVGARRAAGIRGWWAGGLLKDGPFAFVQLVGTALVTYVASWTGWILTRGGSFRNWAETNPSPNFGWLPDWWRSLWTYHQQMFSSTESITSPHPYQTNPWSWLIQGRPTSFFYEGPKKGADGCLVDQCSKAITSIGTVSVWWGATLAIFVLLFMWALHRDWRAGAILCGIVAGYLPWFFLGNRTIYSFYEVAFVPWIVLACVYVLGLVIGGRDVSVARRRWGLGIAGGFVLITIGLFAFFYPIYTAQVIPLHEWQQRMWFPSWV
jgi:dolichyl-phosphate-mannose--protein O-mannosyl transferase